MKGQAYIGTLTKSGDKTTVAYTDCGDFGVTFLRGWREALLKPEAVKTYSQNDSRLENGIRMVADAKYAKAQKRDIQLSMILEGDSESDYLTKLENFYDKVAYNGMFYLKVPCLNKVFKVVYSDCPKFGDYSLKKANFTLKLTEPNPKDRDKITE